MVFRQFDDACQGSINTSVTGNVIANDWDPDGNLNLSSVIRIGPMPANGTLTLNANGTFTFVPVTGYIGQVSFNYQVCDLGMPVYCDTATVTIDILPNPTGNSTMAVDDSYFGPEDSPITGNVLINDYDPQGHTQSVNTIPVAVPLHGVVNLNSNGTFVYTPALNYNGPDKFVYRVCDNGTPQACTQATVYLLLSPANDPPVTYNEITTICSNEVLSGNVFNGDYDPDGSLLAIGPVIQNAVNGAFNILPSGAYTYTPNGSFNGIETVIVSLCDTGIPLPSQCANDTITITVVGRVLLYAGFDDTICETSGYTLSGATAQNAIAVYWTTSGTGYFNNDWVVNPTYMPSLADIVAGTVTLTLHGNGNTPCGSSTDSMILTIQRQPIVNAGPDVAMCETSGSITLNGATAQNGLSYVWTSSGTGTFSNTSLVNPVYTPSAADIAYGNITLTLSATAHSPCNAVSDAMILIISRQAIVNAGINDTICGGSTFVPGTSSASNYTSLLWTSSGTGTFNDPAILHPIYSPSASDILNGFVFLTLHTYSSAPCQETQDEMILTIHQSPVANAGPDEEICQANTFTINGASVSNNESLFWTHTGQGTLLNPLTISPTYVPASTETGKIYLILHAAGTPPCGIITDTMSLIINIKSVANAGGNAFSCGITPYLISGSNAEGYSMLFWSTSGTGIFNDPTLLHPVYTPTNSDVLNGNVVLTLTVNPLAECAGTTDHMILTIRTAPVANAGPDGNTCQGEPYAVNEATVSGNHSLSWSFLGTGSLLNATTLTPTYIPGNGETGIVKLILSVTGNSPCGIVSDTMVLTIVPSVQATAGIDLATCETSPVTINGASASNYSTILWTTSGSGTFSNPTAINPVYSPSTADVNIGLVILTMQAKGNTWCADVTDQLRLTMIKAPVAQVGGDAVSCFGIPYPISGASAMNYVTLSWTFEPINAGVLVGQYTLTPVFTPKAGFSGKVTFTLSATGNTACGNIAATDQFVLTVGSLFTVNAGADQIVPKGSSVSLLGSANGGSGFFAWNWEPGSLLNNPYQYNPMSLPINRDTIFILRVLDMNTGCIASDTVKVWIGPGIPPPIANMDHGYTNMNTPTNIKILDNDSIQPGSNISISTFCQPDHGVILLISDNIYTYTPDENYLGDDEFCYKICDDRNPVQCDTAIVKIYVESFRIDIDPTGVITPNDDGYNDIWIIRHIEQYPDNQVIIFNRWGDKIREYSRYDNNKKSWDGTNEDFQRVPDGVYYYIIKWVGDGKNKVNTGWILVRGNN